MSLANVPWFADIGVPTVRIPSPASYLLAKSLTYPVRKPHHKDKDCAYIYLLARITQPTWTSVRQDLDALDTLPKWRSRAYAQLRDLFVRESGEGPIRAARSLASPEHSELLIRATVRRFLIALGIETPT